MPKEIVIDFDEKGCAEGMHFDDFDLGFLGQKEIKRASEILWCEISQSWWIQLPGHITPCCEAVTDFSGYDVARQFEVDWLQGCRKEGVEPDSEQGHAIARGLRTGSPL